MAKSIKSLDIHAKVKFGRFQIKDEEPQAVIWKITAKDHSSVPAYPTNSVTLHTEKGIHTQAYDAKEPTNPDTNRTKFGNNRYLHTNMLQWLNSDANAGEWYVPQHAYDAPPDSEVGIKYVETLYFHRPGFLHLFSDKEKEHILETTIRVVKNMPVEGGGYEDIVRRVFFPSVTEVGLPAENDIPEGARWEAYTDDESRLAGLAKYCVDNYAFLLGYSHGPNYDYWLRTPGTMNSAAFYMINIDGVAVMSTCYQGQTGVRPAINITGDTLVSDDVDEDGCYTVILDKPPTITTANAGDLGVLSTPLKQNYTITDPDNDALTITETVNGEVIRTLTNQTSGTKLTLDLSSVWQSLTTDTPHTATVEVTDDILTDTRQWTFMRDNAAPSITTDKPCGDLGKLATPLQMTYKLIDPNKDSLTVTETLDGQVINTLPDQPSNTTRTLDLTEHWASLSRDTRHTVVIEVTDGLETASYTWTFQVIEPIEQHITSNQSAIRPTNVIIPVLPVQVLVTNNANDAEPVWEDASDEYLKRKQYGFHNKTKTADEWCVAVKYNINGVTIPVKLTTMHEFKFS